ncbi:9418_t:CDS:2 [Entrophospora sp. SA101]|nr:9418_t:CDS:2 [Entrophospora sp. SA101]
MPNSIINPVLSNHRQNFNNNRDKEVDVDKPNYLTSTHLPSNIKKRQKKKKGDESNLIGKITNYISQQSKNPNNDEKKPTSIIQDSSYNKVYNNTNFVGSFSNLYIDNNELQPSNDSSINFHHPPNWSNSTDTLSTSSLNSDNVPPWDSPTAFNSRNQSVDYSNIDDDEDDIKRREKDLDPELSLYLRYQRHLEEEARPQIPHHHKEESTPSSTSSSSSDTLDEINLISIINSDELFSLSEDYIISILQREDLDLPEIEIWLNLLSWGISNTPRLNVYNDDDNDECYYHHYDMSKWMKDDFKELRETLKNCIKWIRFFQIGPQEFAKYVLPFKRILPKDIVSNFLRQQITGHMPIFSINLPPRIPSTDIESTIIAGRHATIISNWIKSPNDPTLGYDDRPLSGLNSFNLLFRATRDTLTMENLYSKCHDKGPIIILAKLCNSNCIVGGYNPLNSCFENMRRRLSTSHSYSSLPSTKSRSSKRFSINSCHPENNSIVSRILPEFENKRFNHKRHPNNGFYFGAGPDLWINIDCKDKIVKNSPLSYEHRILDSSGIFIWEDFEVFQVVKN